MRDKMKKARIFMTAKEKEFAKRQEKLEKEEEYRKKMKQLTRFSTQLEELSERMEKSSESMYLAAKENTIKGLDSNANRSIEISAKMKQISNNFKIMKNRVDICIMMIDASNVIFYSFVKIPEEFSEDLMTDVYNNYYDGILGIDKALLGLEMELEITTYDEKNDYDPEIDCCNMNDESHKLIVEKLKQRLIYELTMESSTDNDGSDGSNDEG